MTELNVHIAEVKIARKGEILKSILGSCVGIGFIWKQKKICGLAHCLLPKSPVKKFSSGARFVDQAISMLITLMKINEENISEIEVIIAGGGNMTGQKNAPTSILVGEKNVEAALLELKHRGFKIQEAKTGGEIGHKMTIFSHDFTYSIECIPRILKEA